MLVPPLKAETRTCVKLSSLALRASRVPLLVLALVLVCGAAEAQQSSESAEEAAVRAEMENEMRELDAMVASIEDILDVYLTVPERREVLEGVVLKNDRVELWTLRPLELNVEAGKCDAYRWLLLGRLSQSKGAAEVFRRFKQLSEITLVFYQVETSLENDGKGGYVQNRSAIRHLEITLGKKRALSLDPKALRKLLGGTRESCIASGEQSVDHHWYIK